MEFTSQDLAQIHEHGLNEQLVNNQIKAFIAGFPHLNVVKAASVEDGIIRLSEEQIESTQAHYNNSLKSVKVVKFVPASGAATRMFKELFEFVNDDKRGKGIDTLLNNIEKFAFYPELKSLLSEGADEKAIVRAIILEGLNYGKQPKGLVTFHAYADGARKAVEEHLVEGAAYAASNGTSHIHFTVSPEHLAGFKEVIEQRAAHYEQKLGVSYDITFSTQKSSTDIIAVNPDNTLFRDDAGRLLFRPAGHGALIENLGDIDADIIFVKNIDNLTTDSQRGDTIKYKRALAGLLLETQQQAFAHIAALEAGEQNIAPIAEFIEKKLCVKLPENYSAELLLSTLNRPMRVCGMVRNEGEPGGGPFWVGNADGTTSLQIAESSQIAAEDMHLMQQATHFNPVDLVCAVRNYKGEKFPLGEFTDPATGFISEKSSGGKALRAQELPGLWNGAMAKWNTIFVEVPITTFSPVKVVQDLLRAQHQE